MVDRLPIGMVYVYILYGTEYERSYSSVPFISVFNSSVLSALVGPFIYNIRHSCECDMYWRGDGIMNSYKS